jgi:Na+/proline symporter
VPLAAGVFWKRANNAGALLSAVLGLAAWLAAEALAADATIPPPLVGLLFSMVGMAAGSYFRVARPRFGAHG